MPDFKPIPRAALEPVCRLLPGITSSVTNELCSRWPVAKFAEQTYA
jgi:hypothetical protein